jgi:hypothetical protein
MNENDVRDELLLPLADLYEVGNRNFLGINPKLRLETYEIERQWLATAVANRWLERAEFKDHYRFTNDGYLEFKPRINALRSFLAPNSAI